MTPLQLLREELEKIKQEIREYKMIFSLEDSAITQFQKNECSRLEKSKKDYEEAIEKLKFFNNPYNGFLYKK